MAYDSANREERYVSKERYKNCFFIPIAGKFQDVPPIILPSVREFAEKE